MSSEQQLREAMDVCETTEDLRALAKDIFDIDIDEDKRRDTVEQDILEAYWMNLELIGEDNSAEIASLKNIVDKIDDVIDDLEDGDGSEGENTLDESQEKGREDPPPPDETGPAT